MTALNISRLIVSICMKEAKENKTPRKLIQVKNLKDFTFWALSFPNSLLHRKELSNSPVATQLTTSMCTEISAACA